MITRIRVPRLPRGISVRFIACIFLLLFGILGMTALASLKEAPPESAYQEPSLRVRTITATAEDIQVQITGYGEARPLDVVSIAPEISGKISDVHPRLEPGEVIGKNEILFRIDSCNYDAICEQARASVEQCENAVSQLQIQHAADIERLKTLERTRELARTQLERMRSLCDTHGVVAQFQVDSAEQAYNSAADMHDQLARAGELYPVQIKDANNSVASARAELQLAESNLARCLVRAPFEGRVKDVSVEAGQYVVPGLQVVTLANDAILEIQVPIDSRDAQRWLQFNDGVSREHNIWFNGLERVPCRIRWTEDQSGDYWEGRLHRVVKFDRQTRTLVVAVRVDARDMLSKSPGKLPLVDGMFCSIEIRGKIIPDVFRLPREAVSFENTVYVSKSRRLKTVPVQVVRIEGDHAIVSTGLETGDLVITTRLSDPMENCLLEVRKEIGGEGK
jgi:multidrug efflux system membrane fusion protein